ncbi:MAG: hypothetical protein K5987_06835 [Lachnospiraceae bacterium]|nr:hypothetical protein [Lachnospiraceae bacterium]
MNMVLKLGSGLFRRITLLVMSIVLVVEAIPISGPLYSYAADMFQYTIFATSDEEGAITFNSSNCCINGSIATNGTIDYSGTLNVNGMKNEGVNEFIPLLKKYIDEEFFVQEQIQEYEYDLEINDVNIEIEKATQVDGNLNLNGNVCVKKSIETYNDFYVSGDVKNTSDKSVIYSEYGNIDIECLNVNLNGLIYAPNGVVRINAQNLNLNNVIIIARKVVLTSQCININQNRYMAEFLGNISDKTDASGNNVSGDAVDIPERQIVIDTSEFELLSEDKYACRSKVAAMSGTVFTDETVNHITIADKDEQNVLLWEYELQSNNEWNVEIEGLAFGENKITVYVECDSFALEKTVTLYNGDIENVLSLRENIQDSDGDGVSDYVERILGEGWEERDFDEDGLCNADEVKYRTLMSDADSDADGISDYDEIMINKTNPLMMDTDGDGISDAMEIELSTNPNVSDGDTVLSSSFEKDNDDDVIKHISVEITAKAGDIAHSYIIPASYYTATGIIGIPYEIHTTESFEKAKISFSYDESLLNGVDENDLTIYWLDIEENKVKELEGVILDTDNNIVSCDVSHFSMYAVACKNIAGNPDNIIKKIKATGHGGLHSFNGNYYMAFDYSNGWKDAKAICEEMDGHLLTISSAEEQKFIEDNILTENRGNRYWIGATSEGNDIGAFTWITGEEFGYTNWSKGEPNVLSEKFVEMYGNIAGIRGEWNNLPEDYYYTRAFICEWEADQEILLQYTDDERFIIVDDLDYTPECEMLDRKMYIDEVLTPDPGESESPVDKQGNKIYGLEGLYNTKDYDDYLDAIAPELCADLIIVLGWWGWDRLLAIENVAPSPTAKIMTHLTMALGNDAVVPTIFLANYLSASGTSIEYNSRTFIFNSDYNYNKLINFYQLKAFLVNNLEDGETAFIATSPDAVFTGRNTEHRFDGDNTKKIAYIISNFCAFASIEYGHAVFVAECTKSNEVYRLKYKYNVLDYYDFSPEAVPGLYKLNRYGCAKNYLTTGYDEGSASFTVDGEITFTDSTEND